MSNNQLARIAASLLVTTVIALPVATVRGAQITQPPSADTSATSAPTAPVAPPPPFTGTTAAQFLESRMELGDGRDVWHPTRAQLGFSLAEGVDPNGPASQSRFLSNRETAIAYFTSIAPFVQRPPVSARAVVVSAYAVTNPIRVRASSTPIPAKILPSRDGAALDPALAADDVIKQVMDDPSIVHIVLPIRVDPPRITEEQLAGIDARIAHYVTHFNPHEVGRTKTVRKAIELVDNHRIAPGEIFSVNESVGERTEKRGFGIGHVFVDGKMKEDVGGGMCQVATTLFNASLLANLQIVERHQHVRTVPYVKAGSDATVWYGKKDFKVRNDTTTPIYISYKTTTSYAICDIYGKANHNLHIDIEAVQRKNAERDYFGSVTRYTIVAGKRTKTYEAFSRYKWTPALDFSH